MSISTKSTDRPWYIAERWQQYEGESRANQLRIIAIGSFYLIHLWNFYTGKDVDSKFHLLVTLLAMAWCLVAVAVHFSLRAQVFPHWLPYASTLCDVVFLTCMLCISTGPRSPLVLGYLLIITLGALRFSLPLVRVATVASLLCYIGLLGCAKWPETFGVDTAIDRSLPRHYQHMTMLGIALCGVIVGQTVRRVRHLAESYVERVRHADNDASNP